MDQGKSHVELYSAVRAVSNAFPEIIGVFRKAISAKEFGWHRLYDFLQTVIDATSRGERITGSELKRDFPDVVSVICLALYEKRVIAGRLDQFFRAVDYAFRLQKGGLEMRKEREEEVVEQTPALLRRAQVGVSTNLLPRDERRDGCKLTPMEVEFYRRVAENFDSEEWLRENRLLNPELGVVAEREPKEALRVSAAIAEVVKKDPEALNYDARHLTIIQAAFEEWAARRFKEECWMNKYGLTFERVPAIDR